MNKMLKFFLVIVMVLGVIGSILLFFALDRFKFINSDQDIDILTYYIDPSQMKFKLVSSNGQDTLVVASRLGNNVELAMDSIQPLSKEYFLSKASVEQTSSDTKSLIFHLDACKVIGITIALYKNNPILNLKERKLPYYPIRDVQCFSNLTEGKDLSPL